MVAWHGSGQIDRGPCEDGEKKCGFRGRDTLDWIQRKAISFVYTRPFFGMSYIYIVYVSVKVMQIR